MATGMELIAFEVTKSAIGALVKPTLTTAYAGLKSLSQSLVSSFGDRFSEYVSQQAYRHSRLSTIVFGHQKSLDELYIPLTVVESRPAKEDEKQKGIKLIDLGPTCSLLKQEFWSLILLEWGNPLSQNSSFCNV